jgi:transposase
MRRRGRLREQVPSRARETALQQVWAGVDIGKAHHHAVIIDSEGRRLLSRRVANDETMLRDLIAEVTSLASEVTWAIDVRTGGAALLVTLLLAEDQKVFYLSGRMVNRAADGYRGEGKTDARDAAVIADQARMRRCLIGRVSTSRLEDRVVALGQLTGVRDMARPRAEQ